MKANELRKIEIKAIKYLTKEMKGMDVIILDKPIPSHINLGGEQIAINAIYRKNGKKTIYLYSEKYCYPFTMPECNTEELKKLVDVLLNDEYRRAEDPYYVYVKCWD